MSHEMALGVEVKMYFLYSGTSHIHLRLPIKGLDVLYLLSLLQSASPFV